MSDAAVSEVEHVALGNLFDSLWPLLGPRLTEEEWERVGSVLRNFYRELTQPSDTA